MEINIANLTKESIPNGSILLNDTTLCIEKIDCIENEQHSNASIKEVESTHTKSLPEKSCNYLLYFIENSIEFKLFTNSFIKYLY